MSVQCNNIYNKITQFTTNFYPNSKLESSILTGACLTTLFYSSIVGVGIGICYAGYKLYNKSPNANKDIEKSALRKVKNFRSLASVKTIDKNLNDNDIRELIKYISININLSQKKQKALEKLEILRRFLFEQDGVDVVKIFNMIMCNEKRMFIFWSLLHIDNGIYDSKKQKFFGLVKNLIKNLKV